MKYIFFVFIFFFYFNANFAFTQTCMLEKSSYTNFYTVDVEKTICLAQNSNNKFTIFYTYAEWCAPCKAHLADAIKLAKDYDVDFYLLLMDKENDSFSLDRVHKMLSQREDELKVVLISDSLYNDRYKANKNKLIKISGKKTREKYSNFLKQITPSSFEVISDMSKFIILDNKGEIVLVTSYKDAEGLDDYSKVFEKVKNAIKLDKIDLNK